MIKNLLLTIILTLIVFQIPFAQNLVSSSNWTAGQGSITGFSAVGNPNRSFREVHKDHLNQDQLVWKSDPSIDQGLGGAGGWDSSTFTIDSNSTYRYSVWVKKTNSTSGNTHFGIGGGATGILELNGTPNSNPFFFVGDLPKLNRWYLLIGYIHPQNYNSQVTQGKIYDGVTGLEVGLTYDKKFASSATNCKHATFLWDASDTADRQYAYNPTVYEVNSSMPSLNQLLRVNPDSKVLFSYDAAGNQTQRFYCWTGSNCNIPTPPTSIAQAKVEDLEIEELNNDVIDTSFKLYPNPTTGIITAEITAKDVGFEHGALYSIDGSLLIDMTAGERNQMTFDLSAYSSGVYVLHLHYDNGETVTKSIIKN